MKPLFATIALSLHLSASAGMPTEIVLWSEPTVRGEVTISGSEIHYAGDIDTVVAKSIVDLIEQQKFDTLLIHSKGGDVEAARKIGVAVFDQKITVVVSGQCSSSCARYIFTGAKTKQIKPEAFVMFSEYKNYYDYVKTINQLAEKKLSNGIAILSESEKGQLAIGEKWVGPEKEYFQKIGVDMRITSLGYVPGKSVSHWVMTAKRMSDFGVSNVALPDDYASQVFCDKMKLKGLLRWDAQCL
ncbi:MAG: hypothetical protein CFE43_21025 [Burkholderiales bacterium PBB3]|nr:MAG: hypothetical protein CFE43_21025 [Burkholderiales bacterium PBB3]